MRSRGCRGADGREGWLIGRKKSLEETLAAAIRAEFVSLVTGLEKERREYRRRSVLKEEAQTALKEAETEVHGLHSERITLGKRFWEAYYGDGKLSFSKYQTDSGALERTIERAEKALEKARTDFEATDFDEDIEGSRLRKKADAAQGEAERRIAELEKALGEELAKARSSVEEARWALQEELEAPRLEGIAEERNAYEENAAMPRTAKSRRRWWLRWLSI